MNLLMSNSWKQGWTYEWVKIFTVSHVRSVRCSTDTVTVTVTVTATTISVTVIVTVFIRFTG